AFYVLSLRLLIVPYLPPVPVNAGCYFFNYSATPDPYTLSLHDALPICSRRTRPTGRNTQQMSNAMKLTMPRFDGAPVLVVGDVMLDRYWHGPSERISPEAPVPVIRVDQIEDRPGGAGNVALNIAA